jgi:alpha-1,3-mannosyl-glycoprotein beta-1,2-N-acetylglucosaminyltransferase
VPTVLSNFRHYGWALNQVFQVFKYDQVIIVEDDLEVAPDFFEYFGATLPLLKSDPSLWCVSAWNDNGKAGLIEETAPERLYRSDFFPGLGWMITKELWAELGPKWPHSYWDDWMREAAQRHGRACIRPEVSRTKTFGKVGVSNGLFYDKHLKFIVLSQKFVPFTVMNLTYLSKDNYENRWEP